jgi:hypothetical protein
VRQGGPFSPLLFNLVADGLACMIKKAQEEGLIPHIIQNGCCCLQYADDTIFLIQDCLEGARNLKFILCLFESMSGLKINFHKSEILCFGDAKDIDFLYADIFTCPIGNLPMKYLGVPIDKKKINKNLWCPMIEKLEKRLAGWQGRFLSLGGRLTLLNSCLSNVPLYMLSIYPAPKTVIKKIDLLRRRLLWQGGKQSRKFHLADWGSVCSPKIQGGLGVLNLEVMNDSFLNGFGILKIRMVYGKRLLLVSILRESPLF